MLGHVEGLRGVDKNVKNVAWRGTTLHGQCFIRQSAIGNNPAPHLAFGIDAITISPIMQANHWPATLRRRRGFFILMGSRSIVSSKGESVQAVCPRCQRSAVFKGKSTRPWFTLFFCPVFPIGGTKSFSECGNCGAQFGMSPDALAHNVQASHQQMMQQAIAMYNSMRASPANSVTLNNLMALYGQLGEFDQALAAAREFTQALNNSEQCMATLGRVLTEQKRIPEAVQWFDAALQRNPALGEAAYYKAIALASQTPPDYPNAIASARAARGNNFPAAENLLRDLEAKARTA